MFSKQKVFCNGCGKEFETTFGSYGGHVCSRKCYDDMEWKRTLSILGKEYYPKTRKENNED